MKIYRFRIHGAYENHVDDIYVEEEKITEVLSMCKKDNIRCEVSEHNLDDISCLVEYISDADVPAEPEPNF